MSTYPLAPGHRVERAHFPRDDSEAWVRCQACKVTVSALPDSHYPDRWQPILDQWFAHRTSRPVTGGRKGHPSRVKPRKNPCLFGRI